MSWLNLGEVFYVVRRLHGHEAAESVVRDLRPQLDLGLPDATRVLEAATIKTDHACGYADAFAAATATAHQAPCSPVTRNCCRPPHHGSTRTCATADAPVPGASSAI